MKKTTYCLLAMLWPLLNLFANPTKPIQPLTVGDKMHDITFSNLINYGGKSNIKLSDLKGKLVILDFWSTRCGACIDLFPHMNKLQQQFGKDLQVILVNTKSTLMNDDSAKIERLFAKLKEHIGLNNKLPIVYGLDTLDALFPCQIIPHEIWIDKTGKIIGITSAGEVTEANIRSAIKGEKLNLRLKKDVMATEESKPNNQSEKNNVVYKSILTQYQDGYAVRTSIKNPDGKLVKGITIYNMPLLALCTTAASDIVWVPSERIMLDVTNPEMFKMERNDTAMYRYSYCYDLTIPPSTMPHLRQYMLDDLKRAFNITIKKESRVLDCYVIMATDKILQSLSKGGKPDADLEPATLKKYITNQSVSDIAKLLSVHKLFDMPLVDGSGLVAKFDLSLPFDLSDHQALTKCLSEAGLEIRQTKKEMEVMVITDR